jgi:hypothetical protein
MNEVARKQIKENRELMHIGVIIISAYTLAKTECLTTGANYFFEKPS